MQFVAYRVSQLVINFIANLEYVLNAKSLMNHNFFHDCVNICTHISQMDSE